MSLIKKIKLETPELTTVYDVGAVATNVSLENPITVEQTQYTDVESALNAVNNKSGGGGDAFIKGFKAKEWTGIGNWSGDNVWTDIDGKIYYSNGSNQYQLDLATSTWERKTWNGVTSFTGSIIWNDGVHIYISNGNTQYELDHDTDTWTSKTWVGLAQPSAYDIWSDGTDIYYDSGNSHYVYDRSDSSWSVNTWTGVSSFQGRNVWTDGNKFYLSNTASQQLELDIATKTWSSKTWTCPSIANFYGLHVWTDGKDIFYSYTGTISYQWVLDKATSTWRERVWVGAPGDKISATKIWTDGNNYYLNNGTDYKFVLADMTVDEVVGQAYGVASLNGDSRIPINQTNYVNAGQKSGTSLGTSATAEGVNTTASGAYTHAGGSNTSATATGATAFGLGSTASHQYSFAEGSYTQTGAQNQHVSGKYNVGKSTTLFEIGNGTSTNARANAFEVSSAGNVVAAGSITDGSGNSLSDIGNKVSKSGDMMTGDLKVLIGPRDQVYASVTNVAFTVPTVSLPFLFNPTTGVISTIANNPSQTDLPIATIIPPSKGAYIAVFDGSTTIIDYTYIVPNESSFSLPMENTVSEGDTLTYKVYLPAISEVGYNVKDCNGNILSNKLDSSKVGVANGVASLDAYGKVPTSQIPGTVDEIKEGYLNSTDGKFYEEDTYTTEIPAATDKIYVDLSTNKTYRWGGSAYIEISASLALGETSTTAFAGDRGKTIEDCVPSGASSSNKFATANDLTAKQNVNLTTPIVVEETTYTTVETAMNAINNKAVTVTVDDAMSTTSTNPVQNKVITEALDGKANVVRDQTMYGNTWSTKAWDWTGSSIYSGQYIWTDGTDVYYSHSSDQFVLNKSNLTWETKSWNFSIDGDKVWTDGTNIYYSNSSPQYVLNKAESKWEYKTWTGLTKASGNYIWTDGTTCYYSNGASQYVLDKSTSTWSTISWTGLSSNLYGNYIWTDGTDTYCSYGSSMQYVLDSSTSTWSQKTWTGLTNFYGQYVWTDGTNIYYSFNSTQYVLNKTTSTWTAKTWNGDAPARGEYIWTDGTNMYYSYNEDQYILPSVSGSVIENSIIVKSNGDLQGTAEIYDAANNALSDKYDATSLTFPNERFTITASSWSSTQTGGYYTYTLSTGTTKYNTYSDVTMANVGSTDSTDATSAEKAAYALVNKFDMAYGTGVNSFTLYAKTKPTTTFYIKLSGRYMAKNAASSTKALDIETGCGLTIGNIGVGSSSYSFNGSATRSLKFVRQQVYFASNRWSSTVDANGYYTCSDTLANINTYWTPDVSLTSLTNPVPSSTEIAAYNLVDYFGMADGTAVGTITAYAKTKPTAGFYAVVKGVVFA